MNDQVQPSAPAARMDWFLLLLLAISLSGNVLLGYGVFRLSTGLTASPVQARQESPTPKIGLQLPALDVKSIKGDRVSLTYGADPRPTVIYVFTPTCIWCARNLNNLKTVLAAGKESYRFIGLSLSPDVEDYVKQSGLDFPVYVSPSGDAIAAYGLGGTPSTLVVSPQGQLLKFWRGAYTSSNKSEVQAFFHVTLPGLTTATE